ncbi:Membrane protein involved in the export of O-antigen and teichoic acid [Noviherbaspirillum humi]|uniref:Membrane protein involved in the export of O-antigen and teichoic acid n=1 Tax=Noviherbaspirillum humi TaxID=1688639 RepID=A0A239G9A8_9BURK|nr:oligosaccharide flippase family protein [Noviherbaspirillum humi]SNS65926.1 Membrane protein involved in the export of O-antigen and teichoic acid [Noviherbaspirillum humi]
MSQLTHIVRRMLPKNPFARGVSVLVAGTASGHLLTILVAPVLTRLYQPEDFGLLAVFTALAGIVSNIASLRYQASIPLPDSDEEADALLILSLGIVVLIAGACAVPLIKYSDRIAHLLNTPKLARFLWLLPLGIFSIGIFNAFHSWAIRTKAFAPIAKTRLSQSAATAAIQLGGATIGPAALLVGQITGYAIGAASYVLRVVQARWSHLKRVRFSSLSVVAIRYKQFPLFSTWGSLFNTVGAELPSILFAVLFSPAVAGIYALANRVLSVPMQLLGQAIADVFFSDAADASREGRLEPLIAVMHSRLAHIAMPPILVLLVSGPDIFSQIFGQEWREAGVFAQWLAPWLYLAFITSTFSSLFAVLDKLGMLLVFEAVSLVVRAAGIIAGASIGGMITAVALMAVGSVTCRAIMFVYLMRVSGSRWHEIGKPTLSALIWAIPLTGPIIVAKMWGLGHPFWLLGLGTATIFIAARYACLMKEAWA